MKYLEITAALPKLSRRQLSELNKAVIRQIRVKEAEAVLQFNPGDKVEFDHPKYGILKGTVEKLNKKSVRVHTGPGKYDAWNVSPTLLRLQKQEA